MRLQVIGNAREEVKRDPAHSGLVMLACVIEIQSPAPKHAGTKRFHCPPVILRLIPALDPDEPVVYCFPGNRPDSTHTRPAGAMDTVLAKKQPRKEEPRGLRKRGGVAVLSLAFAITVLETEFYLRSSTFKSEANSDGCKP